MDTVERQPYGGASEPTASLNAMPIELVRMVFRACDGPATRNLRLASGKFARVGEAFLLSPNFKTVDRRKGGKRLLAIATHDRLRSSIESVNFRFGRLRKHISLLPSDQHYSRVPGGERALPPWDCYPETTGEEPKRSLGSLDSQCDPDMPLHHAFGQLPNLRQVQVSLADESPGINMLSPVFAAPDEAISRHSLETLYELPAAMDKAHITSFTCDRLPMAIFKSPTSRRQWLDYPGAFANLTHLNLIIDVRDDFQPHARFRAVQGLGYVLRISTKLTHLSLEFGDYADSRTKFPLEFMDLLDEDFAPNFVFQHLTDLKLAGITCTELSLRKFLIRHSKTLETLQLGSLGLAPSSSTVNGGFHLYFGSFRTLFTALQTKLRALKRLCLLGVLQCRGDGLSFEERYRFVPHLAFDMGGMRACASVIYEADPRPFERYVLDGGAYPGCSLR